VRDEKADIWIPIYIGDYLSNTMHLSTEQHGAYMLLIFAYWKNGGPLPDDAEYLAGVSKLSTDAWHRHSKRIAEFFQTDNGVWRHTFIDRELEKAKRNKQVKSNAGKAGAAAKYGKTLADASECHDFAIANGHQTDSPSPSPSPIENNTPELDKLTSEAEVIYEHYPRKEARKKAIQTIKAAIKRHGAPAVADGTLQWKRFWESSSTEVQFIPYPATFYGQERYAAPPTASALSPYAPTRQRPATSSDPSLDSCFG
jgi:uncharacterized protein YdaU (DUF1376 family)